MFGLSRARWSTGLPQASQAVPSSSMRTVGSMSSQPYGPGVVSSVTSAEPRASLKGPRGLSATATPMALPGWLLSCVMVA